MSNFIEPLATYEDLRDLVYQVTTPSLRGTPQPGTTGHVSTRVDICESLDVETSRAPADSGIAPSSRPGLAIPVMLEVTIDNWSQNFGDQYTGVPRASYPSPTYRMRNQQALTPVNPTLVGREFAFYGGTGVDWQHEMYRDNPRELFPPALDRCFSIGPTALNALVYLMERIGGDVWCEFADVETQDDNGNLMRKQAARLHISPQRGRETQSSGGGVSDLYQNWFIISKDAKWAPYPSMLPGPQKKSPYGYYYPILTVWKIF